MTWISMPGPKHTFLLVAVQPVCSNFEKKFCPSVSKWSFIWHMSVTGVPLVVAHRSVNKKVLGSMTGDNVVQPI